MTKDEAIATLRAAVEKLIKAKGRFHTEQNYAALVRAYDETAAATAPSSEPVAWDCLAVDGTVAETTRTAAGRDRWEKWGLKTRALYAEAPAAPVVSPEGMRETLAAARHYIESLSEESGYGYSRPANPRDFHPDVECCTEEEIAAHKAACEAYDKGEYTPEHGSQWAGAIHILRAPWGIGSYTHRDAHATALIAALDGLISAAPAAPLNTQPKPDDEQFAASMLSEVARMGASAAGLSLAAQLFGVAACEACGYRKLYCRCTPLNTAAPTAKAGGKS